jgi:CheY-like chemotaxis protein
MEAVGQLSGGIAHDFNNLLTIIIGNAETLSAKLEARPDMKRLAEAIAGAGERGAELTQRLLAFSRRQMLQPVEVDCNRMVEAMREILRRTLTEDIDIRVTLEKELWSAFADPAQLENAILNLSLNARDAMPSGGCLTLGTANVPLEEDYQQLHPEVPPGNYVMLSVSDDGAGMAPEVRERAFEPFFTTKEVGKGTGLGLSMVYGFAKQSNGHVTIYSEPGLGTTVRIYLPAGSTTLVKAPEAAEPAVEAPARPDANIILVVEDDPFVRNFAVTTLQSFGHQVIAAVDAQEALAKLHQPGRIDILFTDIVMPGSVNGLQLAEQAKQIRPGMKVLLTSGYALETLASRGRLPQGVSILHKPYRKAELSKRLAEVLQTTG